MHIAIIIDTLGGGGAERIMCQLSSGLIERGHKVDIIMHRPIIYRSPSPNIRVLWLGGVPDRLTEERSAHVLSRSIQFRSPSRTFEWAHQAFEWAQIANAVHWNPLCWPGRRRRRLARTLASYLEVERPDCVLPNDRRSILATFMGCCMAGEYPPIVPVIHGTIHMAYKDSAYKRYHFRLMFQSLFHRAAHFVGVSQGASDSLATTIGVPREKIATIYNPVVTPDLHAKAAEQPDHPWFRDNGASVILAVGRLQKDKDHLTTIRAFARLAARRPCRLIILGEGNRRTEIEGLVEDLNLTDRISLPGWVENPFSFMARASLLVLSSIHEGLPTVLIEALACGCPCVSTDCPSGPAEILLNGDIGPLVPVGDSAALAEAMERVLDAPPDRGLLQQRAAYFSADRAVAAYEDLIASVVRRSGRT